MKVWLITSRFCGYVFLAQLELLKQQHPNIMAKTIQEKGIFSKVHFIVYVFVICLLAHFLVLGHHYRGIVMVVLEADVGSALQQQPHCVHLTSATGAVQGCVPTV